MGRDDWFRSDTWDSATEARFFTNLHRAKDKQQPLRIQANYLATHHPRAALALLDQYFAFGDHFDKAQAFLDQAEAYCTLGDLDKAVQSLRNALQREREFPNVRTQAWSRYALLVAENRLTPLYDDALRVLRENPLRSDSFPVDGFRWNAACALIAHAQGLTKDAAERAINAMRFADMSNSGFRYHPNTGLVGKQEEKLMDEMRRLVDD